ncbi:hypothetical protein [Nitrosomonas sp.]|uniref:hypothetical protein n=1 Tax=Nitrosomonas sp. TaxID=42353 RepID=UPI00284BD497|nr:hypothetical protein [Nitrosomonas sp.]MDR4513643.1 hypothetical protein [Nitrosomonas sp.]
MISDLKAALEAIKIISDLLKANKSISNRNELDSAVYVVNEKLILANEMIFSCHEKQKALTDRIANLEKNLAEYDDFERQVSRYILHEFESGMFAYALKPGMANGEPMHYLCNNCMENRKLSKLQPVKVGSKIFAYVCHCCKSNIK